MVAVPAALRSVHPGVAGVPSWAAVLIGITGVLAGFAIEAGSGHRELGAAFTVCYVLGCLAAVLAVRQSGIFSAVIQPPLLLFIAVPLGYFLLHSAPFNGLKDALITCGYPLIERFPLMLFTSAAVLVIGIARWYFGSHAGSHAGSHTEQDAPRTAAVAAPGGLFAGLGSRLAAFTRPGGEAATREARPRHVVDRGPRRAPREGGRGDRRETPRRERTARAADRDYRGYDEMRPRRDPRDPAAGPRRDARGGYGDPRPRRDTPRRPARERDIRDPYPPESPRQRRPRRDEPVPPRRGARDSRAPYEPRPGRAGGAAGAGGYASHDRYPPYDPYAARPDARRTRGAATDGHHPVSRVRYRGEPGEERRERRDR